MLFSHLYASQTLSYRPGTGRISIWREGTNEANGMTFDRQGRLYACEGAARRVVPASEVDGSASGPHAERRRGEAVSTAQEAQVAAAPGHSQLPPVP